MKGGGGGGGGAVFHICPLIKFILLNKLSVGSAPKVPQCSISVKNGKAYEFIRMDNIQLV